MILLIVIRSILQIRKFKKSSSQLDALQTLVINLSVVYKDQVSRNFGLGLLTDYSASEIPEGGLFQAMNWLVDRQGRARARSGTASLNGTASTPVVDYLLGLRYTDAGGVCYLNKIKTVGLPR